MYRGKRQLPRQVAKSMAKEVSRKGNAVIFTAEEVAPTPPRPIQPTTKLAIAQKETIQAEPQAKKVHKRTNPGSFPKEYSAPAHVHPEGKRWVKTLTKQARIARTESTKKMAKRKG